MQLSSRILTALAVLILAVAVVAVRAGSTGTVEAATGTIDVLNVGTCYTTDTDVFAVGACNDGDPLDNDGIADTGDGYNVAGRDAITKVDSVFATYAIDPKTSGDEPRAIAKNADVIKISIEDKGRDKRTGKIYPVGTAQGTQVETNGIGTFLNTEFTGYVKTALTDLADELLVDHDADGDTETSTPKLIQLTSTEANFDRIDGTDGVIANSGDAQFRLTGTGSATHRMAPDGDFYWFGLGPDGDDADNIGDFADLSGDFITLDEDFFEGRKDSIAPWMRVSAAIPAGIQLTVQYIYYQTSEKEDLIGGRKSEANNKTR